MGKFKGGVARLKERYPQVPVIPVFLQGAGKALPRGEIVLVPVVVDAVVGHTQSPGPVTAPVYTQEMEDAVRALGAQLCRRSSTRTTISPSGARSRRPMLWKLRQQVIARSASSKSAKSKPGATVQPASVKALPCAGRAPNQRPAGTTCCGTWPAAKSRPSICFGQLPIGRDGDDHQRIAFVEMPDLIGFDPVQLRPVARVAAGSRSPSIGPASPWKRAGNPALGIASSAR